MKKVLITLLISIYHFVLFGQEINDLKYLLDSAYILKRKYYEYHYKYDKGEYFTLFYGSPYSLNNKSFNFKTIDVYNNKNKNKVKKGVTLWDIRSVKLEGTKLKIFIVDFNCILKERKHYYFANMGSFTVIFTYSVEKKKWLLESQKSQ